MDRRRFLLTSLAGALAAPLAAEAQQKVKVPKLGILYMNSPVNSPVLTTGHFSSFSDRLRELGWIDGRNVAIELRGGAGEQKRFLSFAAELVRLKVDVIAMDNGTGAKLVQESTTPIPICVAGGDLQAAGVLKNLAKPEGNITGVQVFQPDLVGKRLALPKETVPGLTRVGMLSGSRSPVNTTVLRIAEDASRTLGLELHVKEVALADDLEPAFSTLTQAGVRGLIVMNNPALTARSDQVVALAMKSRMAAIYEYRNWPVGGGLTSYGAIIAEIFRQLAECVDKILRGAKPGDVPVQQPTKFEFVINLKTARTLGLTIPPSVLARADQVID
jgi:putative tryptophan/tyrosine transport system substrate-binding protein